MADYRETVNSLAMEKQIVKLRQKIEIEQKLKQRLVITVIPVYHIPYMRHISCRTFHSIFESRRTINERSQRSQRRESTFIANRAMKVKRKT